MSQTDLGQGDERHRVGGFPVEEAINRASESINGYDPRVATELSRRVDIGHAIAIKSITSDGASRFVGCAMFTSPELNRIVVLYIDGTADVMAACQPTPVTVSSKPQAHGDGGPETGVMFELGDEMRVGSSGEAQERALWMVFHPSSTPVESGVDHAFDINGVRASLYTDIVHDKGAWRSSIFNTQEDEVVAAVSAAFTIADELKLQRDAAHTKIGSIVIGYSPDGL